MSSPVIVVKPSDTLAYVRNIMLKEGISRLVVVEGKHPIGTITRKDIIRKIRNQKFQLRDFNSIYVYEVMRSPVSIINEDDSIILATKKMVSENIRGLPVVDSNEELVGIITKTDITRYFAENFTEKLTVKSMCQRENLPVIHKYHSIYRVINLLDELNTDRVIVLEGNKPIGIITETDLSFIAPSRKTESFFKKRKNELGEISYDRIYFIPLAEDIMTENPIVVEEDTDASKAAKLLIDNNIGGMPVVNSKGELSGLITKFDFVKVLARGEEKLD